MPFLWFLNCVDALHGTIEMGLFIVLQDPVDHCRVSPVGLQEPHVLSDFLKQMDCEVDHGLSWLLTVSVM